MRAAKRMMVAFALLAAWPAAGQDHKLSAAELKQRGIYTVRDAIAAMEAPAAHDPRNPAPIGNPGQWFGPDAYPAAAIRAGAQGRVIVSIAVDDRGRATGCAIQQSSGSPDLDAATCLIGVQRMAFTPGHDPNGRAIAGHYVLPVRWQLPANDVSEANVATILVSIGPDGSVLSCASVSPSPLSDMCGAFPVGRKLDVPEALRGRVVAVGTIVHPLAQ